jgi:hypothetical protein
MTVARSADSVWVRRRLTSFAAGILCLTQWGTTWATPAEPALAQCITDQTPGRPWLEKTLWGLRDQERGWLGAEVENADGSADLGPLQINSSWIPKIARLIHRPESDVRRWLSRDTCFNVQTARWIFLTALAVTKDYWQAVGLYHSPTAWRQRHYARAVAAKITRRFGSDVFVSAAMRLGHVRDSQKRFELAVSDRRDALRPSKTGNPSVK